MLKVPYGSMSEPQRLDCLNWPAEWPYKPTVEFSIGYDGSGIRLDYTVDEQSIRALQGTPGGEVYEDSCVEFFFQPSADDSHYYNFEWNAIGNLCLSWRTGRFDPEPAPAEVIRSVQALSSCGSEPTCPCGGDPFGAGPLILRQRTLCRKACRGAMVPEDIHPVGGLLERRSPRFGG